MKHLVDMREPITTADIEKALDDADEYLRSGDTHNDLVGRLAAIIADAYGYDRAEADE